MTGPVLAWLGALVLCLWSITSANAMADKAARAALSGRVLLQEHQTPLAGIPIHIEGTELRTFTDELGYFGFESAPAGDLTLLVGGVVVQPTRFEVSAARTQSTTIYVRYADSEHEVTVTAPQRKLTSASTSHISQREIAAAPMRTAEDALRLVPGLTLVQHGSEGKGHQFFLRGFDAIHGTDLELTVEGIPINEWSNVHAQGYIDLGFITPEVIESVVVTKGPFTLEQGAFAMAGTADYQLGVAERDRGLRSSYTIGTTNRHRGLVTYSPTEGTGEEFIAVEGLHDDGFGRRRSVNRGSILGRIHAHESPRYGTLALMGSVYGAAFELPGTVRNEDADRIGFYGSHDEHGKGFSGRSHFSISHAWRAPNLEFESSFYGQYRRLELLENYTGFLLDRVHGDRRDQRHDSWTFGSKLASDVGLTDDLALQIGLGARGDVLEQRQLHVAQDGMPLETERHLEGVQLLTHALFGLSWRPVESLRLAAGARSDVVYVSVRDRIDENRRGFGTLATISPRGIAEWEVLELWKLFAAYGHGFRPPEARAFSAHEPERTGLSDDIYDGGQPSITTSNVFELGTRWAPSPYLNAQLSGFVTWIDQESIFDHVSGINLRLNSTRRLGAELVLRSDPTDWLTLIGDVTYADARFTTSGRVVPLAPPLVGSVRAVLTHNNGFHAGLRYFGMASRPLPHGARGAALAVVDATAGYAWRWLRLDVGVENVLDRRLREGEYHYASHWQAASEPSEIPVIHYVAGSPRNARFSVSAVF